MRPRLTSFFGGVFGGLIGVLVLGGAPLLAETSRHSSAISAQGIKALLTATPLSLGASGGSIGLWGVTPAARPGAFTQTYSTAAHTVPADTSHAITDSSGGTPSTTAIAAQAVTVAASACAGGAEPSAAQVDTAIDGLETAINAQLVIIRNNTATLAAELALVKADHLATKKVANAIIDDGQSWGALQ